MTEVPPIRLAMLGMIPGNEHPYSWSAIINGYNVAEMDRRCPSAGVKSYLGRQAPGSVGIPGARVTHVWTDDPAEAPDVAAAALIPQVVSRPIEVIGQVDAVMIATDDGDDHVRRAAPFVEAGLPVFVDKPLAVNVPDLRQFLAWKAAGGLLQSSSGLRYSPELDDLRNESWRWITGLTSGTWERYGIHVLEPIYTLLGPGFETVRSLAEGNSEVLQIRHRSGTLVSLAVIKDAAGCFGTFHAYGARGHRSVQVQDFYTAFRRQLVAFVDFVRTRQAPFPFSETTELMSVIMAGRRSREEGGRQVSIREITTELEK